MTVRDVQAVIEASDYVRHGGVTRHGGSYSTCICPAVRCGAVVSGDERDDCPEHSLNPVQYWHWAAECPVPEPLIAARLLVRRGLAVTPLPAGGRVPAPGWQRLATLDETALPGLFDGECNIAVACRASHVVALDLDDDHGPRLRDVDGTDHGPAVLADLADRCGQTVPETFTIRTPHGGRHLYFRVADDCTIGSSSGSRSPLGPGIDVRGPGRRSGGYLLGPGSIVDGRPYLILRDVPVAPLPDWIGQLLQGRRTCAQ